MMESQRRLKKPKRKFPIEKHTSDFLRGIYCFAAECSGSGNGIGSSCDRRDSSDSSTSNNSGGGIHHKEDRKKGASSTTTITPATSVTRAGTHVVSSSATTSWDSSLSSSSSSASSTICGICLEDVTTTNKRFGLLSCDHCFCLNCVMKWRRMKSPVTTNAATGATAATHRQTTTTAMTSTNNIIMNTTNNPHTRSCPTCRKKSEFVVPSKKFCVGVEKEKFVSSYMSHLSYKSHVSTVPCKRFTGEMGSCPFGHECFYAHYDSYGQDIKRYDLPMRGKDNSSTAINFARWGTNALLPEEYYTNIRMDALTRYIRNSLYDLGSDSDDENSFDFDNSTHENEDVEFFAIIEHEKMMLKAFGSKM